MLWESVFVIGDLRAIHCLYHKQFSGEDVEVEEQGEERMCGRERQRLRVGESEGKRIICQLLFPASRLPRLYGDCIKMGHTVQYIRRRTTTEPNKYNR